MNLISNDLDLGTFYLHLKGIMKMRLVTLYSSIKVVLIWLMLMRESHAVILWDRVVPASQVPFPGEPSGEPSDEPGNGTWWAGTTLYGRNDSVGFFFSPVFIILHVLLKIRTKTSFYQCFIRFIRIYHLLWLSVRVRNKLLTNHRRDIKTQGEGRWAPQEWIIPCLMWSDIFSLSHYKIKEIARLRMNNVMCSHNEARCL